MYYMYVYRATDSQIPTPLSIPSLEFFVLENGPTCIHVKKQDVFILLFNPSSLLNS